MTSIIMVCGVLVIGLVAAAGRGEAATFNVASHGIDTASCGSSSAPCGSINHAITRASAGDKIVVGPGRYTSPGPPACSCVVLVDKAVTVESRDGALVTIIDAAGAARDGVRIQASGVTFGGSGRGFTVRGAGGGRAGLTTSFAGLEGLVVAGNVASDNEGYGFSVSLVHEHQVTENLAARNGGDGFFELSGTGGTYARNTAIGNARVGFLLLSASAATLTDNIARENGDGGFGVIAGNGLDVQKNGAHGNALQGFDIVGGRESTYRMNAASGNAAAGFRVAGAEDITIADSVSSGNAIGIVASGSAGLAVTGNTVTGNGDGFVHLGGDGVVDVWRNAFLGNLQDGVDTASNAVAVTQNNIVGNGQCGLRHSSGGQLIAKQNFWGSASGPGPDPADTVCNALNGSTTVLTPVATKPVSVPVKAGK